jgi:DNA polymerase III alpha subunit
MEEARRLKIKLLPPDINYSAREFSCAGTAIRTGLNTVFELTERTINRILQEQARRPFADLFDFLNRSGAGEKESAHLIKAGAMNSLHPSAPQLLLLNKIMFRNNKKKTFGEFVTGDTTLPPYNLYQKILNELELLDCAVSAHPLNLFDEQIDWSMMVASTQLENYKNQTIHFCGWLVTSRRVSTSKNQYMKFLTMEDKFGLCEVVLFSEAYIHYGHLIKTHGPYIITGQVQSRLPGEANLIAEKVELVEMQKGELESLLQKKIPPQWDAA